VIQTTKTKRAIDAALAKGMQDVVKSVPTDIALRLVCGVNEAAGISTQNSEAIRIVQASCHDHSLLWQLLLTYAHDAKELLAQEEETDRELSAGEYDHD
jgi:hypothetical protein